MVSSYLRAAEEAQQQRRYLLAVLAGSGAVARSISLPGNYIVGDRRFISGIAQTALAALDSAEAALSQVKNLLPQVWLNQVSVLASTARKEAPAVRIVLPGQSVPPPCQDQQFVAAYEGLCRAADTLCGGCDKRAAGLRKCARCRTIGYCR